MRKRIAIHICPEQDCAVTGRRDQSCPAHGHCLEREVFVRESESEAERLRKTAERLREAADKVGNKGQLDATFDKLFKDFDSMFGKRGG